MPLPLAQMLIAQRAKRVLIDSLPATLVPTHLANAYQVQTETALALGPVGAWKVSPYPSGGEPMAAPIPASTVFADKALLDAESYPAPGIEAEIAVTLSRDLPMRETPYGMADISAAIGSVHLAIELLSSRFADPASLPALVAVADLQNNAAVILGESRSAGDFPELGKQALSMSVDGAEVGRADDGSSSDTVLRSLTWLANHAAARGLALKKGNVIITGARIGALPLNGRSILVDSEGFPPVSVTLR